MYFHAIFSLSRCLMYFLVLPIVIVCERICVVKGLTLQLISAFKEQQFSHDVGSVRRFLTSDPIVLGSKFRLAPIFFLMEIIF